VSDYFAEFFSYMATFPSYGVGGFVVLALFVIQVEIRFSRRASSFRTGASDRYSSLGISVAQMVPALGFIVAMKASSPGLLLWLPPWFRDAALPGLPWIGWVGVVLGVLGNIVRLVAVLTLRERFTRTLLIQSGQTIERGGPYRWVRHPGYLGSLLCLNGLALASGNLIVLIASVPATWVVYSYRIKVEDEMLVANFGPDYAEYRRQVGALIPRIRGTKGVTGTP